MTNQHAINERALSTDHVMADLGAHAAKGGMIAIAAQPIRMLVQFASTAIMARLLSPDDFGLVAMATTVTAFVSIFSDMGLSLATVQRKTVDQDLVSGLLFINIAIGLALMPVAWLAAPFAAMFFQDPRIVPLIVALSIVFPLSAAGSQHTAILLRTMRYMALQWAGLIGHLFGTVAGILAAWLLDLGYWALVVNLWISTVATMIFVWGACPWRPSRVKDWSGARSSLSFGLNLTGFSVVNFFHRQLDNIIIGWRFGSSELGYYSRAYQLMMIPVNIFNNALSSAIEPSLSRLQHEPERWRRAFLDALGLTAFLGSGLSATMLPASHDLIAILYGPKWTETARIFEWLAASSFAGVPLSATGWIYISLGRTQRMFAWSLIFTPIVALSFLAALPYGAVGVAVAYAIVLTLALVPAFAFAVHGTPVSLLDTIKVLLPMIAAGVMAAMCGKLVFVEGWPALPRLILTVATAGLAYLLLSGWFVLKGEAYAEVRARARTLGNRFARAIRARMGPRAGG